MYIECPKAPKLTQLTESHRVQLVDALRGEALVAANNRTFVYTVFTRSKDVVEVPPVREKIEKERVETSAASVSRRSHRQFITEHCVAHALV